MVMLNRARTAKITKLEYVSQKRLAIDSVVVLPHQDMETLTETHYVYVLRPCESGVHNIGDKGA